MLCHPFLYVSNTDLFSVNNCKRSGATVCIMFITEQPTTTTILTIEVVALLLANPDL